MSGLLNLLVIDDDKVDRLQLKRALANSGFECNLTELDNTDPSAGLGDMDQFDCVFLDYLLPGHNGLSLLKQIRDNGIKTPIVIVTSQGNESIAVELMKAGASDYVVKNEINGQSLAKILRNMLRITRMLQEREEAERALRISESRLAEAQRIARLGNLEIGLQDKSIYCSPEVYSIFGVDPNCVVTVETLLSYIHREDRELVSSSWTAMQEGKSVSMDFRITTSGMTKFVNAQGYAARNSSGVITAIVQTVQDITERKLAEQEITKAREEAESSLKVREIFLANMSHEIRTPMNAILGFTRLLNESDLTKEQRSFIDAIQFSGENLLVIINDILDLSKIRSGKLTIDKCAFNLRELIKGVVAVLSPKAQEKGLKMQSKIDEDLPSVLNGDPVRLNQVLTNLISNAIKFTEAGSVTLEVTTRTNEVDNVLVEFKVKDTGIGIPMDKQEHIFESFVQGSADTTRKFGGTGLGLTIVKSLIELQSGKVWVNSDPGRGSEFIIQLPFGKVASNSVPESAPIETKTDEWQSLRDKSVLLVEDNPINQLLVRKVLNRTGCKLEVASNGLDAIAFIRARHFDVVLMDIQMPEMDGYEATAYIRNKLPKPLSEIPILAMTAHAFGSDVTRCISIGMNDHICKPFKAEELYSKIAKWASGPGSSKVISLNQEDQPLKVDLSVIDFASNGDQGFINELIVLYNKQTPMFVDKLKGYVKSHNFEAIRGICHQIHSSYGIVRMPQLEKALREISVYLNSPTPENDLVRISDLVNVIISLISIINEEVKRGLRRTG